MNDTCRQSSKLDLWYVKRVPRSTLADDPVRDALGTTDATERPWCHGLRQSSGALTRVWAERRSESTPRVYEDRGQGGRGLPHSVTSSKLRTPRRRTTSHSARTAGFNPQERPSGFLRPFAFQAVLDIPRSCGLKSAPRAAAFSVARSIGQIALNPPKVPPSAARVPTPGSDECHRRPLGIAGELSREDPAKGGAEKSTKTLPNFTEINRF